MTYGIEHEHVSIDPQRDITYSPENVDAYAEHLSDVNKIKEVVASTDIVSQQGIVLLRQGQRITRELVDRIVQHKLIKSIESSVAISDALSGDKLVQIFTTKLAGNAEKVMHARFNLQAELQRACDYLERFPLLIQKLTVMSIQMPQEFDKALVVAWGSLIVSQHVRLQINDRNNVFVAALMHDIGMLHLPREITDKSGALTPAEWRAIKSHVIIGQKIMEQNRGLPPIIGRAIAEHHEMCDGTGYPGGLFHQELCVEGQIIAALDAIYAISYHKLAPKNLGTRPLIPIFQINAFAYLGSVANAIIRLLRDYEHGGSTAVADAKSLNGIAEQSRRLAEYHDKLSTITKLLVNHSSKRQVRAAFSMLDHLNTLLRSSGILNTDYVTEIERRAQASTSDIDVEDCYVMLQELQWHLVKLNRTLHAIIEHDKALPPEDCRAIAQALKGLPELSAR